MRFDASEILARLKGGLIVSCQAYPGEACETRAPWCRSRTPRSSGERSPDPTPGHRGHRAAAALPVPVTGLWKEGESDVFITPTLAARPGRRRRGSGHRRDRRDAAAAPRRAEPRRATIAELRAAHDVRA